MRVAWIFGDSRIAPGVLPAHRGTSDGRNGWLDQCNGAGTDDFFPGLYAMAQQELRRRFQLAFHWTDRGLAGLHHLQLLAGKLGVCLDECFQFHGGVDRPIHLHA